MHKCRACVASLSQHFRLRFFQFPGHKAKLNLSQTATSSVGWKTQLRIDVGKTGKTRISCRDGHDTIPSKSRARSAQSCVFSVVNRSAAFCHLHYHHPSCSLYVWLAFACCFLCLCHHNKSLSHQYWLGSWFLALHRQPLWICSSLADLPLQFTCEELLKDVRAQPASEEIGSSHGTAKPKLQDSANCTCPINYQSEMLKSSYPGKIKNHFLFLKRPRHRGLWRWALANELTACSGWPRCGLKVPVGGGGGGGGAASVPSVRGIWHRELVLDRICEATRLASTSASSDDHGALKVRKCPKETCLYYCISVYNKY